MEEEQKYLTRKKGKRNMIERQREGKVIIVGGNVEGK